MNKFIRRYEDAIRAIAICVFYIVVLVMCLYISDYRWRKIENLIENQNTLIEKLSECRYE